MIYFTSDLHLGHRAIIHMQNRPFANVDEMNRTLIRNINNVAHRDDRLYILGDVAHHIPLKDRLELLSQIKCKKYLIFGNHDKGSEEDYSGICEWVKIYHKEALYGLNIIMMHYPLMSWDKMRHGSIMLHGHIHAGAEYNLDNIANNIKRFDIGVDANNYMPVSIETIREWASLCKEEI